MVAVPAMDMAPQKPGMGHESAGMSRYWLQVLSVSNSSTAPLSQLNMKTLVVPVEVEGACGSVYTAAVKTVSGQRFSSLLTKLVYHSSALCDCDVSKFAEHYSQYMLVACVPTLAYEAQQWVT
eukprot:GHRQ01034332.1.p1 GENE.GHRQ01034332.1~~GHRQ01034332.1.p1  ORF type:complete len:123 (+),score=1.72 GHRQ01034332.1:45-413(+)